MLPAFRSIAPGVWANSNWRLAKMTESERFERGSGGTEGAIRSTSPFDIRASQLHERQRLVGDRVVLPDRSPRPAAAVPAPTSPPVEGLGRGYLPGVQVVEVDDPRNRLPEDPVEVARRRGDRPGPQRGAGSGREVGPVRLVQVGSRTRIGWLVPDEPPSDGRYAPSGTQPGGRPVVSEDLSLVQVAVARVRRADHDVVEAVTVHVPGGRDRPCEPGVVLLALRGPVGGRL
jgi:hypothetical protein